MAQPSRLSQNAIKLKFENSGDLQPEDELILQILDHKVFDASNGKKGIKSR